MQWSAFESKRGAARGCRAQEPVAGAQVPPSAGRIRRVQRGGCASGDNARRAGGPLHTIKISYTLLYGESNIFSPNIDLQRENQKEQQFFCHFECFRRLVTNDGVMYIMDSDFSTVGEIQEDEENWPEDDGRA